MNLSRRHIDMVRVDIPLRTASAFLFVDANRRDWDPWWTAFYEYLVSLAPSKLDWKHEPVQNVYVARPELTGEQRAGVFRYLCTAPSHEVEAHRTLRRAVALSAPKAAKIVVVYFSAPTELDESSGGV